MSSLPNDRETYNQQTSKSLVNLFTYVREVWQAHNRDSLAAHEKYTLQVN